MDVGVLPLKVIEVAMSCLLGHLHYGGKDTSGVVKKVHFLN